MLFHYIKMAIRNLIKYKVQSIISIIGVSIGLVSFILGYQWLKYETSYDGFYPRSSDIYKVASTEIQTGKKNQNLPFHLIDALGNDFPEIEEVIPIYSRYGSDFKDGDRVLSESEQEFVDESFFIYFPPKVICGKETGLLDKDENLVITRSYAIKNFGSPEDALNKKLITGYDQNLEIVSVIEDYPENSMFSYITSFEKDKFTRRFAKDVPEDLKWKQDEVKIYFCLNNKVNKKYFEQKLANYLIDNRYNPELKLEIIPLTAVRHSFGTDHSFNINYIRIFAVTTLILLVCVLLNFINLWMNNIFNRIKEMKLRYSIGAGRFSLAWQLLMEIILQFVFILLLSCCFIEILEPIFIKVFEIKLDVHDLWMNFFVAYLIGFILILLISLPIVLLLFRKSALQLSGGIKTYRIGVVRHAGIIFQVGIAVSFIFCALCISHQVYYMMNKDFGFKKEGLIHFLMTNREREATTRELESIPLVQSFTGAGIFIYSHKPYLMNHVDWEGKPDDYKPNFQVIETDYEFVHILDLKILEGDIPKDDTQVLVNEAAARIIGRDNLIGSTIQHWRGARYNGEYLMKDVVVTGIVKNFQSASLRNPILPQIIVHSDQHYDSYSYYVRVPEGREEEAIEQIRGALKKHASDVDPEPEIHTVNEIFGELHKSEEASLRLFILLAILTVLISLFGMYSISYSNMKRRRREIAIRKIMGSSVKNIIRMFILEYLQIVIVAILIFTPFSWYFIHQWVQQFSYQAPVGWGELIFVIILSSTLILLTVLGHILKASSENPSDVVKSE